MCSHFDLTAVEFKIEHKKVFVSHRGGHVSVIIVCLSISECECATVSGVITSLGQAPRYS